MDILNSTNLHTPNLFGLWVAQDLDDPSRYTPFILQGGLLMPDREYYLDPSAPMAAIRAKYQEHIAAMLTLAHQPDPAASAARIFALEHRMAEVHGSRADSEDVLKGNNHWQAADFPRRAPGLDWAAFFNAAGLSGQPTVRGVAAGRRHRRASGCTLPAASRWTTWPTEYLRFHLIEHNASYLPKAFVTHEAFEFPTVATC